MEFTDVVRRRRMTRRYDPQRPVPEAVVRACLANAVRAPSAGFTQGWDFVVLSTPAETGRFWTATTDPTVPPDAWLAGLSTAPVLIVCCSNKLAYLERYADSDKGWTDRDEARWPAPYWDIDTGMAALLMLLTAVDEGLGSLFFGIPPDRHVAVHAEFDIPLDRRLIGVVALGYPLPGPRSPSLKRHRRTADEVAHWGRFGAHRPSDGAPV